MAVALGAGLDPPRQVLSVRRSDLQRGVGGSPDISGYRRLGSERSTAMIPGAAAPRLAKLCCGHMHGGIRVIARRAQVTRLGVPAGRAG